MSFKKVGVIGAGQMGNGIAQVVAAHKVEVVMMDVSDAALERGVQTIAKSCDRLIKKEKMTEGEKSELLGRIQTTTEMTNLKACDFVVEAATENVDLKLKIFKQLDEICSPETLLATNTSSISITKIASVTRRPEKVCGMHFMNPVPLMVLVEGISGLQTSPRPFQK